MSLDGAENFRFPICPKSIISKSCIGNNIYINIELKLDHSRGSNKSEKEHISSRDKINLSMNAQKQTEKNLKFTQIPWQLRIASWYINDTNRVPQCF